MPIRVTVWNEFRHEKKKPAIAEIYPIEELNIGHNIISRAALVGLDTAVREMLALLSGE